MRYLILFLMLCLPAWSDTHYAKAVASGAANGTSKDDAWALSTAMIAANVAAGDLVLLYDDAGTFGAVAVAANSAQGSAGGGYITYRADTGEVPQFDNIDISDDSGDDKYLIFDGLLIQNDDGTVQPVKIKQAEYIKFQNCTIKSPIYSYTGLYAPYYHNNIYSVLIQGAAAGHSCNYLVFDNNVIDGFGGIWSTTGNSDYVTITNNDFSRLAGNAISFGASTGWTITGNSFHNANSRMAVAQFDGTITGTFTVGDTVTQANGATGYVAFVAAAELHLTTTTSISFLAAGGTITDDQSGATMTSIDGASGYDHFDAIQAYVIAAPINSLTISRNTIYDCSGTSAIAIWLNDDNVCNGITIESNKIHFIGSYGLFLRGVNTDVNANFNINNNTIIATVAAVKTEIDSTYHSLRIDNFYNNLLGLTGEAGGDAALRLASDSGVYTATITNHNNNSMESEGDGSNHWTSSSNDITNAVLSTGYFADWATQNYELISGSPASRTGSALGATLDKNAAAFYDPPDRGCYRFNKGKLITIRK
jgi:hypothetical protein